MHSQVRTPEGQVRVDACVNAANTLAAWAELEQGDGQPGRAGELLSTAVEGYQRALGQEEDAAVGFGAGEMLPALLRLVIACICVLLRVLHGLASTQQGFRGCCNTPCAAAVT